MSNQTAVEWLVNEVNSDCLNSAYISPELIKQAKKMEKEQMIDAYKEGCLDYILDEKTDKVRAEQYYNKTYKK